MWKLEIRQDLAEEHDELGSPTTAPWLIASA